MTKPIFTCTPLSSPHVQPGLTVDLSISPRGWQGASTLSRDVKISVLPALLQVMRGEGYTPEVQLMACWALGMLTYNDSYFVQHVLREGVLDTLITWLQQETGASEKLRQAAALAIGNLSYNN